MGIAIEIIIIVASIVIIACVLLQESRTNGLSGSIGGGAEQLFGKKRANFYDNILHKVTIGASIVLFIAACIGILVLG